MKKLIILILITLFVVGCSVFIIKNNDAVQINKTKTINYDDVIDTGVNIQKDTMK
jgi:uncharacterized protein YxeA